MAGGGRFSCSICYIRCDDQIIPHNDPAIQKIAAARAALTLEEYRELLQSQEEEELHFDEEEDDSMDHILEEIKNLFNITDDDLKRPIPAQAPATVPSSISAALPSLATTRADVVQGKSLLQQYYLQGIPQLCRAVFEEEIDAKLMAKKGLTSNDLDWTAREMQDILNSTPRILLESIVSGNPAKDRLNNPVLQTIHAKFFQQAALQPSIYYQQLVDRNGNSPSPNELLKALDLMEGYMKGCQKPETNGISARKVSDQEANNIDTFRGYQTKILPMTDTQNGFRKYMFIKVQVPIAGAATGKGKISFICPYPHNTDPTKMNSPLDFPLCEVGYSNRSIKRLKAHKSHDSSNYIMNLMEAIFQRMRPRFSRSYKINQTVIYLIWRASQAEVSEIGWTKLAEGYIHNGGGFSHYPAGLSNESAQTTKTNEWGLAQDYARLHSSLPTYMKHRLDAEKAIADAVAQETSDFFVKRFEQHVISDAIEKILEYFRGQLAKGEGEELENSRKLRELGEAKEQIHQTALKMLGDLNQRMEQLLDAERKLILLANSCRLLDIVVRHCETLLNNFGTGAEEEQAEEGLGGGETAQAEEAEGSRRGGEAGQIGADEGYERLEQKEDELWAEKERDLDLMLPQPSLDDDDYFSDEEEVTHSIDLTLVSDSEEESEDEDEE